MDSIQPQAEKTKQQYAVILFADIMNSSQLSDSLGVEEYGQVVRDFQELARSVANSAIESWFIKIAEVEEEFAGDQAKVFIVPEDQKSDRLSECVSAAIDIAIELKIKWLGSENNKVRVREENKAPTDLGMGIHVGPVTAFRGEAGELRCEGYAINLAKRVEGTSRDGRGCRIVLSSSAHFFLMRAGGRGLETVEMPRVEMKGILEPPRLFEIIASEFRDRHSMIARTLSDLDMERIKLLRDLSFRAMIIARQVGWYGLLCVALLYELGKRIGSSDLLHSAVDLAESILRQEYNASLCGFLGQVSEGWNPNKGVAYNQKALRVDPTDYISQFNLAVSLSHTRDIPDEFGGQTLRLRQRVIDEYRAAEHLARAQGLYGHGGDPDWKLPLFQAHVLAGIAEQAVRERGGHPRTDEYNPPERFTIRQALALYAQAHKVLLGKDELRERWLSECLFYWGVAFQGDGQTGEAASKYQELVSGWSQSEDQDVKNMVQWATDRLGKIPKKG